MHHHIALRLINIILVASSAGGNPRAGLQKCSFPSVWQRESLHCGARKPPETLGNPRKPLGKSAGNPGIQVLGTVFEMPGGPQKPSETFRIKFTEKLATV